jgi:hypothetical protein
MLHNIDWNTQEWTEFRKDYQMQYLEAFGLWIFNGEGQPSGWEIQKQKQNNISMIQVKFSALP